jgi:hypothetical protein
MSIDEFKQLNADEPPPGMPAALLALLHDARGNWTGAHDSAQGEGTSNSAWVHAYLHRKEGDLGNAAYWYRRAGRPLPDCSVEAEWGQIARELLKAYEP